MTSEEPRTQERCPQEIIDHHTLRGEFALSGGGSADTYVDLRSALLCGFCAMKLAHWYEIQMEDYVPVATGSFGALLLGYLSSRGVQGILWNPKAHGLRWAGDNGMEPGCEVVIIDDVVTTGNTLRALRAACEARGWTVVAEIVAAPAPVEDAPEEWCRTCGDIEDSFRHRPCTHNWSCPGNCWHQFNNGRPSPFIVGTFRASAPSEPAGEEGSDV